MNAGTPRYYGDRAGIRNKTEMGACPLDIEECSSLICVEESISMFKSSLLFISSETRTKVW
jgi:hypothetical protein